MKILISGGGIGGCTLAYFLKQYGFTPVVVEVVPEFKRIGYLLALNLQIGQQIAQRMGLLEELKRFEVPLTKNRWYDMHGRLLKQFELDSETNATVNGLFINRADLHLTLYDAVKNDVEFRFGEEIASIAQNETIVEVTFTNGQEEMFDLVIGADGIHSKTRQLVFGKGFEKYLGQAYFAFIIPDRTETPVAGERELISIRGNGFWIAYALHSTKKSQGKSEVGGYIFHEAQPFVALPPKDRHSYMIEHYGKYDKNFLHLLETLTEDDFIFHGDMTQIIMPVWHKDRVCLIGDAAYCPTAASGVGASMAMAGAYILAKRLSESHDYQKVFAAYDAHLRPYMTKIQASADTAAEFVAGRSIVPYGLINALIRLVPVSFLFRVHSHAVEVPLP